MPKIADAGDMVFVGGFIKGSVSSTEDIEDNSPTSSRRTVRTTANLRCDYEVYGYEVTLNRERKVFCPVMVFASLNAIGLPKPDPAKLPPDESFKGFIMREVMIYVKNELPRRDSDPPEWSLYEDHIPK